jgi:hypothetical protein
MSMKSCRECGQKVSSEARVCPGCGVKKPYQSPVRGFIFIGCVAFVLFKSCSGGGSSGNSYHSNDVVNDSAPISRPLISPDTTKVKKVAPANLAPAATVPFTSAQVCKATIAGMFGRKVGSIKTAKTGEAGVFTLSYRRPSDGQHFSFDCKLSGDNVIWRESGQSSQRWNGSGNVEFNVVFTVKDTVLTITELHADSDDITYKFTIKDFK